MVSRIRGIFAIHSSVKRNNKKERRGRRKYTGYVCVSIAITEGLGEGEALRRIRARVFHSVDTPQSAL